MEGYIKDEYYQKRIFVETSDGASVPVSLVYKVSLKNSQGGNPLLLNGYGAYGKSTTNSCDLIHGIPRESPIARVGTSNLLPTQQGVHLCTSSHTRRWNHGGSLV
jgi:hypothetical protein